MNYGTEAGIFVHDFGTLYLHPNAYAILSKSQKRAMGDGRKEAVRRARRDLRELESALNTIGQWAFQVGIKPHEMFMKPC